MASFERRDNLLIVSGLGGLPMPFEELQAAYEELASASAAPVSAVEVDLSGASASNHTLVTFLIGCGGLCASKGLPISFTNLDDKELRAALVKLGFDESGGYKGKEFRAAKARAVPYTVGEAALKIANDTVKLFHFSIETLRAMAYLARRPWKLDFRETLFYFDKSGVDAVPIVMLICLLVGMILAMQGMMQLGRFGLKRLHRRPGGADRRARTGAADGCYDLHWQGRLRVRRGAWHDARERGD